VLNDNNVVAEVGGTVYDHLPNNSGTVVGYNPKVLLLHYGLNEMDPREAGMNSIIAQYKQCIQSLKTQLPNTKIIVLGLAPVTDAAITKQPRFTWIGTYNDQMRAMCRELGIGFYQNDQFFYDRMHLYGSDGIHIKKELYLHWIKDITKEMGLY
jgi:hypothetical protein